MEIPTLEDIKKEFQTPKPAHKKSFTSLEKIGVLVTQRVGTMGFFLIILAWTILWLGWNTLGPRNLRFDPAPAFVLWLFISNLIQLHLLPLLMVGQNIQSRHAELREQHDYDTDRKAEKEIETILLHLEHQQKLTLQILQRLEKLETKQ
jgi:uncharacterized membrane protein